MFTRSFAIGAFPFLGRGFLANTGVVKSMLVIASM
jgi:hypothetical protein